MIENQCLSEIKFIFDEISNSNEIIQYNTGLDLQNIQPKNCYYIEIMFKLDNDLSEKISNCIYKICVSLMNKNRNRFVVLAIREYLKFKFVVIDNNTYYFDRIWILDINDYMLSKKCIHFGITCQNNEIQEKLNQITYLDVICKNLKSNLLTVNLKLDDNPKLIKVLNGTLVLQNNTIILKETTPKDMLSMCMGCNYIDTGITIEEIKNLKWEKSIGMKNLLHVLKTILREDQIYYFVYVLALSFVGKNVHKIFCVIMGKGNNGKSLLQKLISDTFNNYSVTAPTSLISGSRGSSNSANPELIRLRNKKCIFIQEPDKSEKLNTGRLKELTGNDIIYARQMYDKFATEFSIVGIIWHITNVSIIKDTIDQATLSRLRVIDCKNVFGDEEDPENGKYKKIYNILDNVCIPSFLDIILKTYIHINNSNKDYIPDIILDNTTKYLGMNNTAYKYCASELEPCDNNHILFTEVYEKYKEWVHLYNNHRQLKNLEDFINSCSLVWKVNETHILNIKIKILDDECIFV